MVVWAASYGLRHSGDFVECGSLKGTTAAIIYKTTHLRDSNKKTLVVRLV